MVHLLLQHGVDLSFILTNTQVTSTKQLLPVLHGADLPLIRVESEFDTHLRYMALEDSIRWSTTFLSDTRCPRAYSTEEREDDPNWGWVSLWSCENPYPSKCDQEDIDTWDKEYRKMHNRVLVAWSLPQFRVFDWSDKDVALARKLVAGHVCRVCGRSDDPGCMIGC